MDSIIKTIIYFDLFNYPLTSWELWRLSDVKKSYGDFLSSLNNFNHDRISFKHGFYYLTGRENILVTRQIRYNVSDRKFKRAIRTTWWLSRLPWINLVGLANQIGAHNLRAEGDIDFFIITKPNRLWLSRLFLAGSLKLLNLRPKGSNTQDTFCLSFWVSESQLALHDFKLNNDLYFTYWLASLTPLFDADNYYDHLIASNTWLNNFLPNWQTIKPNPRRSIGEPRVQPISTWSLINKLENLARNWQIKHLPTELKSLANLDTRVVVNTNVAKLHSEDRRVEFYKKYLNNL
jgi:hypothetical protein